jgi:hypothetical protein
MDIYEQPVINDSYYDENTLFAISNNKDYVIPLESNYDYFNNTGYETPVVLETSYELASSEQSNNYELAQNTEYAIPQIHLNGGYEFEESFGFGNKPNGYIDVST